MLGTIDVTAQPVEGREVLGVELPAIDEVLEAAGVVAPHGSTDDAFWHTTQGASEVLWRVEGEGTDSAVEGPVESLVNRRAAGGVVVAFLGGGLEDGKAVPLVLRQALDLGAELRLGVGGGAQAVEGVLEAGSGGGGLGRSGAPSACRGGLEPLTGVGEVP